jgi:hypothetical protein
LYSYVNHDTLGIGQSAMDDLNNMPSESDDWYQDTRWKHRAAQERIQIARRQFETALTAIRQCDCRRASQLLVVVHYALDEDDLTRDEWLEVYVAQMICYAWLGDKKAIHSAWKKARMLEPDSVKLQEVGVRLGLL